MKLNAYGVKKKLRSRGLVLNFFFNLHIRNKRLMDLLKCFTTSTIIIIDKDSSPGAPVVYL